MRADTPMNEPSMDRDGHKTKEGWNLSLAIVSE
jgi:hypothetical protein